MEEQGLEKNPKLEIAQWIFSLTLPSTKNDATLQSKLMAAIKEDRKYLFIFTVIGVGRY